MKKEYYSMFQATLDRFNDLLALGYKVSYHKFGNGWILYYDN